jgi:hypothetical protein
MEATMQFYECKYRAYDRANDVADSYARQAMHFSQRAVYWDVHNNAYLHNMVLELATESYGNYLAFRALASDILRS